MEKNKIIKELEDMGLHIVESDAPNRENIDFSIADKNDNVAWVWGSGEEITVNDKFCLDYEVECDHSFVEYDDDEIVGYCPICGSTCDWHWENDGEYMSRVPHSWNTYEEGDGGLIKKYIEGK